MMAAMIVDKAEKNGKLTEEEKRIFVEMTKIHLLEGTSKWSAKVAIRGRSLPGCLQTETLGTPEGVLGFSVSARCNRRNSGVAECCCCSI